MTENALVPIEQRQVIFYEDEITAVLAEADEGQEVYVSIRQLCDLQGVSYQGQMRRINDDPVLSRQVKGVNITLTPSGGRGGGPRTTYKQLPAARFDRAMAWLTDWYQRVTGATAPGEAPW